MNNRNTIRFDLLDGLRGVAALAVMIYHYSQQSGLHWLSGAWVSVDLFFILSGFVIAYNYADKIILGMSFIDFLIIRLVRLWPLYLFGLSLGFFTTIYSFFINYGEDFEFIRIINQFLFGIFWIPKLSGGSIFPLNNPAWSLFFELFVNLLFFIILYFFKKMPNNIFIAFIIFGYLFISFMFRKINPGWSGENFFLGFPRVVTEFLMGAYIYSSGIYQKKYPLYLSIPFIMAPFFLFFTNNHEVSFLSTIFLIPISIIFAASFNLVSYSRKICKILGDLSYPIYVIHFPFFVFIDQIGVFEDYFPAQKIGITSMLCIVISFIIVDFDINIRKKLLNFINIYKN